MLQIRRAADRGHANHGWLDTHHTFSFASYYDPDQMGFRSLRVMNEDRVAPGMGFGTHRHENMEIVSYVLQGELEHKDSMGNGEVLKPGELQRITAGTGITHSEFNPSASEATNFYQIWLLPEREGLEPSYQQEVLDPAGRHNKLQLVASNSTDDNALTIHQDAQIYLANLDASATLTHALRVGRHSWLQVLRGSVELEDNTLKVSDGVAISNQGRIEIRANTDAEIMLFDLA